MLVLIPSANIVRLETSLVRVPHVFLTLRADSQKPVVWLAGPRSHSDVLGRAARSAYLEPLSLPTEYQGTPGNIITSLRNTIETTQRRLTELQDALARLAEERGKELRELYWQAHTSRVLADAILRFGQLRHTYVLTGWVPVDKLEDLTRRLKQASPEILIETLPTSRTGHNQNVPVALFQNKWLRPFQMLVTRMPASKYETKSVLSSYLWSHFGDLLGDAEASSAYSDWAGLMGGGPGVVLDVGSAVGRFAFEMSRKSNRVVGIDNSVSFVRSARELMVHGRTTLALRQEGHLTREETLVLPEHWQTDKVEFIVADALALPFRSSAFSGLDSLNIIDKVPVPLRHLRELNRVARENGAEILFSDPFSWSTEAAREEDWLGGKDNGPYSGRGIDNVAALLQGDDGQLLPPWRIRRQGHVWWKIRTHANHFELIRSCFINAER